MLQLRLYTFLEHGLRIWERKASALAAAAAAVAATAAAAAAEAAAAAATGIWMAQGTAAALERRGSAGCSLLRATSNEYRQPAFVRGPAQLQGPPAQSNCVSDMIITLLFDINITGASG